MANDLIPFKEHANRVTGTPTAAVTGKRFVSISGDRNADGSYSIAPTPAGGKPFGVAAWDCPVGGKVTVVVIESGDIVPVTVGAAGLAANASVVSDAAGAAVVAAGAAGAVVHAAGICLSGAAAGADAQILLTRHSVTV